MVTKGILGAQTKAQLEPLVRKNHSRRVWYCTQLPKAQGPRTEAKRTEARVIGRDSAASSRVRLGCRGS